VAAVIARRTELVIEHLVLERVRPSDATAVGEALGRELARLVRDGGLPDARIGEGGNVAVTIDARHGESPSALGARLATAIYGRLRP
jgi:hypothetical protein